MQNVADVLRAARKGAGIAQKDLAVMLEISTSYMNDIEKGRNALPEGLVEKLPDDIRRRVATAIAEFHLAAAAEAQKWAY